MVALLFLVSILGAILLALGLGAARAGTISAVTPPSGPGGTGVASVTTGSANNDNVGAGNNNVTGLIEVFTSIAPIDAVFTVSASTTTTEYLAGVFTVNATGVPWTDFHFQLIPATPNGNLDFDFPDHDPVPSSTAFSSLVQGQDTLDWSGGGVSAGGAAGHFFSIDVPNGVETFTLRAIPTVPEPSTAIGVGVGLLGLFAYSRLRRPGKPSRG